jgi:processive 1,2-diacylglycerol beta-glucosyltransferase
MRAAVLTAPPSATPREQRQRALFLYSPVGGGHFHTSRAVMDAWLAGAPERSAETVDYLQFMPAWERRLWPGLYLLALRHWPSLWRRYRRWTNRPSEPRFIRNRVTHVGVQAFTEVVRATRPRLVVSTIGGAAALAGAARARLAAEGISFVNALVVSGFRAHHHWARPEADLFFVSCDESKADLVARGIEASRVSVVGIPIGADVAPLDNAAKAAARARLGLGADPVVLVSSGATGAYRALGDLLTVLARTGHPMDVLVFKGGGRLGTQRRGMVRVHNLGVRDDFCAWLAASDLVVGKLGGHTAAEAFAAGVPLAVYRPIPGQEEENAAWVEAAGAGVWPRDRRALEGTLGRLLGKSGTDERAQMSRVARRLARPDAAARIARALELAVEARA